MVVGEQPGLTILDLSSRFITELDLSRYPLLERANHAMLGITETDLSNNPMLKMVFFWGCKLLREIDLSNNPLVERILIHHSAIERVIWPDEYPNLTDLEVELSNIRAIELGNTPLLVLFDVFQCPLLETIDLETTGKLASFSPHDNPSLKSIEVGNTGTTTIFSAWNNPALESIEIGDADALTALVIYENSLLNTLEIGSAPVLEKIHMHYTPELTEIDLTGFPVFKFLDAGITGDFFKENLVIDMSAPENASIDQMDISGIRNVTIHVHESFPIDDPDLQFTVGFYKNVGSTVTFDNGTTTKVYNY